MHYDPGAVDRAGIHACGRKHRPERLQAAGELGGFLVTAALTGGRLPPDRGPTGSRPDLGRPRPEHPGGRPVLVVATGLGEGSGVGQAGQEGRAVLALALPGQGVAVTAVLAAVQAEQFQVGQPGQVHFQLRVPEPGGLTQLAAGEPDSPWAGAAAGQPRS